MGRSVAQFCLPSKSPEQVIRAAQPFAPTQVFRVAEVSPVHIALVKESEWVAGKKVLVVKAWPAQGGTNVQVETWCHGEPWGETTANPRDFVGGLPKRDLWGSLCALLSLYGIAWPSSVVVHH